MIGIGVAAILASANSWMLLQIGLETAMFATAWGVGTLNGVTAVRGFRWSRGAGWTRRRSTRFASDKRCRAIVKDEVLCMDTVRTWRSCASC